MKLSQFGVLAALTLVIASTGCRTLHTAAPAPQPVAINSPDGTNFFKLCDLIAVKVADDKSKGPYFIDSYGVRGLLVAYDLTGNQKYLDACRNWSDRMVKLQDGMTPAGAYYMHYNRKPGETTGDWYAADCSSIGMGVLATAVRCQGAEKQKYIDSVKKFADLVLNNYVGPAGGISDGLWSKSDKEWWCSSGLFGSLMFNLYANTHDPRYLQAGLHIVDWLNNWDPNQDQPFPLSLQGPAMIMYVMECYSAGWPYIIADPARAEGAKAKVGWCFNWIARQQAIPPLDRRWAINAGWGLKFGGLPFHQYIFSNYLPDGAALTAAGDREMHAIAGYVFFNDDVKLTQLPFFMMMSYAERLDPGAMYRSAP